MLPFRKTCLLITILSVTGAAASGAAQHWPSFRGPDATGVAPASASPPREFDVPSSRNVAWRTEIPGLAHSSPIVWGDRVFVTTAVPSSGRPAVRTGNAGDRQQCERRQGVKAHFHGSSPLDESEH